MMPQAAAFKTQPLAVINDVSYTAADYEAFFRAINFPEGWK